MPKKNFADVKKIIIFATDKICQFILSQYNEVRNFVMMMNVHVFENICRLKRQLLPNDRMILFGSQARGDARPDSDWDLLLLLNKAKKEETDEDKAFEFVMMGWEYGTYMSIKIYTNEQWEKRKFSPFYENVVNEGIEII